MGLAIFAVPVAVAGIFGASEFLLSKNSKWTALAEKYRLTGAGPTHWNACRFLQVECQEGSALKRTSYS